MSEINQEDFNGKNYRVIGQNELNNIYNDFLKEQNNETNLNGKIETENYKIDKKSNNQNKNKKIQQDKNTISDKRNHDQND